MFALRSDQVEQCLQLCVMLRRNVGDHKGKQLQIFGILFQFPLPRYIIHVGKVDFDLFAHRKEVSILIVVIEVLVIRNLGQVEDAAARLIVIDRLDRSVDQRSDAVDRPVE